MFYITLVTALLSTSVALADIVSTTYTTNSSNDVTITQITLSEPASTATGDLLLANIAINASGPVVTAPSGWNLVRSTDNGTNLTEITYEKVAGASEPGNYTWTINHQTTAEGGITRYTGVDGTNPIDTSVDNIGYGKVATTSAITTSANKDEIITLFATDVGKNSTAGNYFSTATGMTKKYDISNTPNGPSTAYEDVTSTSSGTFSSVSSNIGGNKSVTWTAQTIALRMLPPISTNGLISYWKLDGNSNDAVGGNNGTDSNILYGTAYGKINQGAAFDGVDSGIDTHLSMSVGQSYSVSEWVYLTALPTTFANLFWSWDTSPKIFALQISNTGLQMQTGYSAISYPYTFATGTWYLVTATSNWDGSNYINNLYLNGVNVGSNSSGGTFGGGSLDSYIGSGPYNGVFGGYFQGHIDEVGVWNRALSPSEVSALYNGGNGIQYPF